MIKLLRWMPAEGSGHWQGLESASQAPRYRAVADMLRSAASDHHVLDVGCGEGVLRNSLPETAQYTGIELSAVAAQRAINLHPTATIVNIAAEAYHPGAERFASVVFNEMLYYAADPVGLVRKYSTFLRPDGVVLCSIYEHRSSGSTRSLLRHLLDRRRPISNGHCAAMLREYMRRASWTVVDDRTVATASADCGWSIWVARPSTAR